MPIRVELIDEAVDDLERYSRSGNLAMFLSKLVRLEEVSKEAGLPLGRGLTGWRKIVVGDRDWRIIFSMDANASVATVWVIGDRADSACYEEAMRRLARLQKGNLQASSLAAVLVRLMQSRPKSHGGKDERTRHPKA